MSAVTQPERVSQYLTVPEAAELLRIKPRTVYAWVALDKIPFHKPSRNLLLFDRDALIRWLESQRPQASAENDSNVTPMTR